MSQPQFSPTELVQQYLKQKWRLVFWPYIGDAKGPREKEWQNHVYTIDEYREGYHRVGILLGQEVEPGKFLHDIDLDWAPGATIAQALLPPTDFIYGRQSKRISHCFYTTSEPASSFKYVDPVDKTTLLEFRGTKLDGTLGNQTMAPPSVWSKEGAREPLTFVKAGQPTHLDNVQALKQAACLAAIAMILARHFGKNGFGHEPRLAWAGFLLKAGISIDELVKMGEAISLYTNNTEVGDVRLVVESTAKNLTAKSKKVKGGPALAKILGDNGKVIVRRINEWLGRDSDFLRTSEGMVLKDHQENIKRALTMMGVELSYNEFSDKLLVNRERPLEDRELTQLWLRIDEEYRFRPSFQFFEKVVKHIAWENPFHPVKDYLKTLTWDGINRIEYWLSVAAEAEDSPYLRAISAIVLIAAVRRIREPGCKYDEMIVLESGQGLQKSMALRTLCPHPEWFTDDFQLNVKSQQMIEGTLGKWIIESSELSGMRPALIEQLKSTLSRQVDGPARLAYAHLPVERPRQFVLIGTTNNTAYLADPSGARRFWPVAVKRFDVAWIAKNRDQLWAEACVREATGESIRLKEELWPEAAVEQEKRREVDPWELQIRTLLDNDEHNKYKDHRIRVTTEEIWQALMIPVERRDRRGSLRISDVMQRMGFVRTKIRPPGQAVQWGFVCLKSGHFADDEHIQEEPTVEGHTSKAKDDTPF